jgi:hypothetical protein
MFISEKGAFLFSLLATSLFSIFPALSISAYKGFIKKGCIKHGSLNWTNGSSISFISCLKENEKYLQLVYTNTSSYSGEITKHDYRIELAAIPSNLGRGELIYFVCPVSGRRARILYKVYGSLHFISRKAYRKRIYYPSQISSKLHFHIDRYWELERLLEKLNQLVTKSNYQGKQTRLKKRITILKGKKNYHDLKRWEILPKSFLKHARNLGTSPME